MCGASVNDRRNLRREGAQGKPKVEILIVPERPGKFLKDSGGSMSGRKLYDSEMRCMVADPIVIREVKVVAFIQRRNRLRNVFRYPEIIRIKKSDIVGSTASLLQARITCGGDPGCWINVTLKGEVKVNLSISSVAGEGDPSSTTITVTKTSSGSFCASTDSNARHKIPVFFWK